MNDRKPPLPGRLVGYALAVVVVAVAARLVWELLQPLLPVLATFVGLCGLYWLIFGSAR